MSSYFSALHAVLAQALLQATDPLLIPERPWEHCHAASDDEEEEGRPHDTAPPRPPDILLRKVLSERQQRAKAKKDLKAAKNERKRIQQELLKKVTSNSDNLSAVDPLPPSQSTIRNEERLVDSEHREEPLTAI